MPRVAMSTLSEAKLPIIVTGDNIELTPALLDHATKKMEKVVARHREVSDIFRLFPIYRGFISRKPMISMCMPTVRDEV